jgi:hypothetical protein
LPPILNSSSSISSSRYIKNRHSNPRQNHQRSLSLSAIVLHCSRSSLFRHHPSLKHQHISNHRRALSYEELFSSYKNTTPSNYRRDNSTIASGCSLAMDLSKSFEQKNDHSSSSTTDTDEDEKIDNRIKQFKWKLKISK